MFEFIQSTPTGGDCTCGYNIELDKDYTVSEFIETVLKEKSDEWGYIGIASKESFFGYPNCQYSRGKLKTDNLPNEYLNKKVKSVKSSGGWTRMDYIITCE